MTEAGFTLPKFDWASNEHLTTALQDPRFGLSAPKPAPPATSSSSNTASRVILIADAFLFAAVTVLAYARLQGVGGSRPRAALKAVAISSLAALPLGGLSYRLRGKSEVGLPAPTQSTWERCQGFVDRFPLFYEAEFHEAPYPLDFIRSKQWDIRQLKDTPYLDRDAGTLIEGLQAWHGAYHQQKETLSGDKKEAVRAVLIAMSVHMSDYLINLETFIRSEYTDKDTQDAVLYSAGRFLALEGLLRGHPLIEGPISKDRFQEQFKFVPDDTTSYPFPTSFN